MNFTNELTNLAEELVILSTKNNLIISTAESCTGGLVSSLITSISGSSKIFDCGFITYSNSSKNRLLNVKNDSLKSFGAVSKEVADEMALGAVKNSNANISLSITGIAGPNTDESNKEVGLVFMSSFNKKTKILISRKFNLSGNRDQIRNLSVQEAIKILIKQIK